MYLCNKCDICMWMRMYEENFTVGRSKSVWRCEIKGKGRAMCSSTHRIPTEVTGPKYSISKDTISYFYSQWQKKNPCYISKEGWRLLKAVSIILSVSCFGKWDKLPWVIFCGFRVSITGHGLEMPSHLIVFTSLKCLPAVKRRISVILFFIVHFRKCSLIYLPVCDEAESGVCLSNNLPASNSNSCYAFLRQHCHHFSIQSMLTASLSLM